MLSISFALVAILSFSAGSLAAPTPSLFAAPAGQEVTLMRRAQPARNDSELAAWAQAHRNGVMAKYGIQGNGTAASKRSEGENLIINQSKDSSYIGSLAVGTPPTSFEVILDTGSSDFWLASTSCDSSCSGSANFNPSSSSSFNNQNKQFEVTYGSGQAQGSLGQDVVQMAGFSVQNQIFGVVTQTSSNFLQAPVTGLIGLAWQSLASSGAMPLWQTLAAQGSWSEPVMAFQLTRFLNDTNAQQMEPGGSLTMGYTNSSLYTGDIDFQNLPDGQQTFWIQEVTSMTVQGNNLTQPSGSASYAAIDTGTTLVAGPPSAIQNLYAQIPGSAPGTGQWEGFYSYPCDTEVNVALSFGGPSWPVSPGDFQFASTSGNKCIGAFYEIPSNQGTPAWIVGDTFLKNVYSVFRFNPPSVGFAALSSAATSLNGVNGPVPTPTIGAVAAAVTALDMNSNAAPVSHSSSLLALVISAFVGCIVLY
ncbi:acid protease [Coniophora puteana RWD-64-598 SS2]|uniref:Acid protease n=1 Tax=Coniophora puteana (strain RWD-64-598) TaxID=741705 RepID=A0A5M3MJL3_CONPW|nr:acid protease [Coniophora puteana RWD-64-598 SS2]EIW79303.1 acid protease [Coniophora puteana RWD-64-598 SS2]